MRIIAFPELSKSNLIVDAVYEGGGDRSVAGDPICRLLPGVGNQGGFRQAGRGVEKRFVVLYSSGEDKDWPDIVDLHTGQFIYFGDNKTPGHQLHDTSRGGNLVLKRAFDLLHSQPPNREAIPPFFVFSKCPTPNSSRSVLFRGLAVPGFMGMSATEDLVAVWKTTAGQRFQNYRAVFTILDVPVIKHEWVKSLLKSCDLEKAPAAWQEWVEKGKYRPLMSEPTTTIRSVEEQTPNTPLKIAILSAIYNHFRDTPIAFESFAAKIFQLHDQRVIIDEVTRGAVDGGRDAVGRYLLGLNQDPVYVDFALEAKCYHPPSDNAHPTTVGVREVSRLISRLRHRQFGVLVTTSVVGRQAYEEVREDRHPIIFICGSDIVEILIRNGYNTVELVSSLLSEKHPVSSG